MTIDKIVVVRGRGDLGDLDGLMASIRAGGMHDPILVTQDVKLLSGHRRLVAAKRLGWTDVPVQRVDDARQAIAAFAREGDEQRIPMLLSEAVALGERVAMLGGLPLSREVRYALGPVTRLGGWRYLQARAIVRAMVDPARSRDDQDFARELVVEMDLAGTPARAAKRLRRRQPSAPSPAGVDGNYSRRQLAAAESIKTKVWYAVHSLDALASGLLEVPLYKAVTMTDKDLGQMLELAERAVRSTQTFQDLLREKESTDDV